jgi:hypothetical protein
MGGPLKNQVPALRISSEFLQNSLLSSASQMNTKLKDNPMKKSLLFVLMALLTLGLLAQEQKEVVTGANYVNDVYYSLENGTVTTVQRDNWDIAFVAQIMSVSVLANNGVGVEVYTYSEGDISDWASLDTTGMDWTPMYNSLETFDMGALNAHTVPNDELDYGWGQYNPVNHHITGDSIFVIKTVSGTYKKLAIIEKAASENRWEFKYANLDGSQEDSITLHANDYAGDYFIHYSLDSAKFVDREPAIDTWDLLFTRYYDYTIPYYVTGVLSNDDHMEVLEVRETGMDQAAHNTYDKSAFTPNISEIGSDWKEFNMGTFTYDLIDTVVYYLKSYADSTYYKIYFTGFTGSTEGKYTFMQEKLVSFLSAGDQEMPSLLQVYPNPATDRINLVFDYTGGSEINIFDMTGRIVYSRPMDVFGFTSLSLDISSLKPGIFFIQVQTGDQSNTMRFIKE